MRTLLLALTLACAFAAPLFAEEEPAGDTPAEKAYRDAWWAETAGGDLTKAIDLYGQSLAGEGPASVKARALYRQAVVLQRVGRTEQALAALERLTKEHPGETALLADARARATEWTAVDLRTGFPEWYRRFQYGPEFQAKIVDLVLKLGVADNTAVASAERELLTIGEPAVAALRAHLSSRNENLARGAVRVLLRLGIVPDEVTDLQGNWTIDQGAWTTILALPAERRAALRARMGDAGRGSPLHAALGTPTEAWEWLAAEGVRTQGVVGQRLLYALLDTLGPESPLAGAIHAASLDPERDQPLRYAAAAWARKHKLVSAADVRRWTDTGLVSVSLQALADRGLWTAEEALAELARAVSTGAGVDDYVALERLLNLLPEVPWPASRERVAAVLPKVWLTAVQRGLRPEVTPRLREALETALEGTAHAMLQEAWFSEWLRAAGPHANPTLERWATSAGSTRLSELAQRAWFERLTSEDLDRALALLTDAAAPDAVVAGRWQSFFQASPRQAEVLSPPERLQRLLDRVASATSMQHALVMVRSLLRDTGYDRLLDALRERVAAAPERFPGAAFFQRDATQLKLLEQREQLPAWRRALMQAWPALDAKQRGAALWMLGALGAKADAEAKTFLRAQLAARPRGVPEEWRSYAVSLLDGVTLDEVRVFYDLSQPKEADEAASLLGGSGGKALLEATPQAFEALRLAFRPDGDHVGGMLEPFALVESLRRPLAELALAHGDREVRVQAVALLRDRSSPEDADLWAKALKDESVNVRRMAAQGIERVPTPVTLKALVAALDDPHPDVRAAALASLDAIQKMEDLKARWKERLK